jgi:hypothetical protein
VSGYLVGRSLGEAPDDDRCDCPLRVVDESQGWRRMTLRCAREYRHDGEHGTSWDGNTAKWDADSATLTLRTGDWTIDHEVSDG